MRLIRGHRARGMIALPQMIIGNIERPVRVAVAGVVASEFFVQSPEDRRYFLRRGRFAMARQPFTRQIEQRVERDLTAVKGAVGQTFEPPLFEQIIGRWRRTGGAGSSCGRVTRRCGRTDPALQRFEANPFENDPTPEILMCRR